MENENRYANDEAPQPPSEGEPEGFRVEMVGPSRKRTWILAGVVITAVLFLVGSVISSSGVMDAWLPWTQEYAQRMVPPVPDGGKPIALLEFNQERGEDTITVTGRILNRTEGTLEDLIATLTLITSLELPLEEDVPLTPQSLEAGSEGTFEWTHPLKGEAGGIKLKFKLASGAVIQHRDSRYEQTEETPEEAPEETPVDLTGEPPTR
jgi:hypothetical protein